MKTSKKYAYLSPETEILSLGAKCALLGESPYEGSETPIMVGPGYDPWNS